MSNEKKLGLAFLGILVVAFCGVLTMRLMGDRSTADKLDVNVGEGAVAAAPGASASGSAPAAKAVSLAPADRPPAPMSAFQRPDASLAPGNEATAVRTPAPPPAYLPPPSAMRPAAESTPPPSYPGSAARSTASANDPFSRGPAPSGGTSPAAAPPAIANSPNPYGAGLAPAAVARSPATGSDAQPSAVSTAAMTAPTEPPSMPLSAAGNPLRGSAPPSEFRSPGVAAVAGPTNPSGFASASTSTNVAEPTLPTGVENAGAPTGRLETAVTFSPPAAVSTGRFAPPGARAAPSSGAAQIGFTSPGGAAGPQPNRDIAVTSAALPAATQDKPYVVAPDDSFWSISEKAYGNGAYYRALFQYNRDRYPNAEDVRPGSVLDIPPLDVLQRQFPELTTGAAAAAPAELAPPPAPAVPPATYVVREGDTLFEIAREQLGKASRWTEIYELNRAVLGENLEHLRPGVELRLK